MVYALVFEDHMLHMSYSYLDRLVAMLDIVVVALLFISRYVNAVMSRKLDGKAEVALAIAERYGIVYLFGKFAALLIVVCHGGCGVLCCLHGCRGGAKTLLKGPWCVLAGAHCGMMYDVER